MRPDILNPLFAETETLDGVGPKLKKPLDRLGLTRVRDLAYHLPERFVTRRAVDNADEAGEGEQIVIRLTVTEHRGGRSPRPRGSCGRGPSPDRAAGGAVACAGVVAGRGASRTISTHASHPVMRGVMRGRIRSGRWATEAIRRCAL